jgi:hypothetical protein
VSLEDEPTDGESLPEIGTGHRRRSGQRPTARVFVADQRSCSGEGARESG